MRVKQCTNIEFTASLSIIHGPRCRLNACETWCTRWIYSILQHQSLYPDVAAMRVKHNTRVELTASLGVNHGALMPLQCVQHTIQASNLQCPSASFVVPWCRLNACKTLNKHYTYNIPQHQSRYPVVPSMHVKHNTNVDYMASLSINHGTPMSPQRV